MQLPGSCQQAECRAALLPRQGTGTNSQRAARYSSSARVLGLVVATAVVAFTAGLLAGHATVDVAGTPYVAPSAPVSLRLLSRGAELTRAASMQQQQHQHQHQQQQQQQQSLQPSSQSRQEQQARQEQPGSAPAAAQPSPSTPSPSPSPVYELVVPDVSSDPRNVLPDVAAKVAEAERQGKGRKLISYSLFGAQPKYTQGAIENAMLVQRDWPGWTFRAYVGEGVPQHVLDGIRLFGGEVVFVTNTTLQSRDCSTFWRFFALEDRTATRVLVRDTDSRLTQRDHAAVTEWMNSTHSFHTTHDHPNHVWAVVGGSWGTVNGLIHPRLLDKWRTTQEGKTGCVWGYDQDWLRDEVWPLVAPYALQHASYHCGKFNASEVRGWPTRRQTPWDRMGNVYTDDNKWLGIKAEWYCPKECRRQPDWTSC